MVSLGVMVYLIARAIPRVGEEERPAEKIEGVPRTLIATSLERVDRLISAATEKTLRRVKVLMLKIEGAISRSLEKKRKFEGESSEKGRQNTALFERKDEQDGI